MVIDYSHAHWSSGRVCMVKEDHQVQKQYPRYRCTGAYLEANNEETPPLAALQNILSNGLTSRRPDLDQIQNLQLNNVNQQRRRTNGLAISNSPQNPEVRPVKIASQLSSPRTSPYCWCRPLWIAEMSPSPTQTMRSELCRNIIYRLTWTLIHMPARPIWQRRAQSQPCTGHNLKPATVKWPPTWPQCSLEGRPPEVTLIKAL